MTSYIWQSKLYILSVISSSRCVGGVVRGTLLIPASFELPIDVFPRKDWHGYDLGMSATHSKQSSSRAKAIIPRTNLWNNCPAVFGQFCYFSPNLSLDGQIFSSIDPRFQIHLWNSSSLQQLSYSWSCYSSNPNNQSALSMQWRIQKSYYVQLQGRIHPMVAIYFNALHVFRTFIFIWKVKLDNLVLLWNPDSLSVYGVIFSWFLWIWTEIQKQEMISSFLFL